MFKPEDFELPLEKVLKLRVITDEVDECTDIEVLKRSLKEVSKLLMTYQHLLNAVLKEQIEANLSKIGVSDKS
jgi:DNA-directed RNA polymerase subunit L